MDHANQIRKEEGISAFADTTSPLHYHYPHHTALAVTSRKERKNETYFRANHRRSNPCVRSPRHKISSSRSQSYPIQISKQAPASLARAQRTKTLVRCARAGASKDGGKQQRKTEEGRGAQGWIRDLGLDGALDEGPQPRHGENEQPHRRVVARLRVPCPAGGHRGRGVEQDRGAVQGRARRGGTDSPPRTVSPPGALRGAGGGGASQLRRWWRPFCAGDKGRERESCAAEGG